MRLLLPRWLELSKQCIKTDASKYSLSIGLGIVFGIILNITSADNTFKILITLPGQLFLRALQCAVVPMMFFNITSSVAQIYSDGKVGSLGSKVFKFYMITTLLAVCNGIAISNVYGSLFTAKHEEDDDGGVEVEFICPKSYGKLTVDSTGNVVCIPTNTIDSFNLTSGYQKFELQDNEDALVNYVLEKRTLTDQIISLFSSIIPNNFTQSFATPNIISVIVLAFVVGIALVHNSDTSDIDEIPQGNHSTPSPLQQVPDDHSILTSGYENSSTIPNKETELSTSPVPHNYTLELCKELASISNRVILWIVYLAPWCIAFLIAGSISQAGKLDTVVQGVAVYMLATITGILIHMGITLPAVFFLYTRENPYHWLYACRKAMLVAFSTSSSAATLPITIRTVVETGLVTESIANIVLPIGANVNMDGTAVGFPCAINFLAHSDRIRMNPLSWLNVAIGSTLGSIGAAPVPSAGLVILITVWETVFPGKEIPQAVAYVQAIDFLLDRFETMANVTSDIVTIRMLQVLLNQEEADLKASVREVEKNGIELA